MRILQAPACLKVGILTRTAGKWPVPSWSDDDGGISWGRTSGEYPARFVDHFIDLNLLIIHFTLSNQRPFSLARSHIAARLYLQQARWTRRKSHRPTLKRRQGQLTTAYISVWPPCKVCYLGSLTSPAESRLAKYIPGGYSPKRCLKYRGRPMMYLVLLFAGVSILFFGYDASVMSQVNTNQDYLDLMGASNALKGNSGQAALVGGLVSIWFLGFAIGALFVGYYADKIGRLKTVQIGCIWGAVGAILQCSAQDAGMMFVARVVGGTFC